MTNTKGSFYKTNIWTKNNEIRDKIKEKKKTTLNNTQHILPCYSRCHATLEPRRQNIRNVLSPLWFIGSKGPLSAITISTILCGTIVSYTMHATSDVFLMVIQKSLLYPKCCSYNQCQCSKYLQYVKCTNHTILQNSYSISICWKFITLVMMNLLL